MPITEFATLVLNSVPDPTLSPLFQKLGKWQAECFGFPLLFFTNPNAPSSIYLITGWECEAAHMAWIAGDENQELLRIFGPFVDMPELSMVHLDIDFSVIPVSAERVVVERYGGEISGREGKAKADGDDENWSAVGRDLTPDSREVYRLASKAGPLGEHRHGLIEALKLKRIYF
ncbi:hypothetical protein F5I97DRAFT_1843306 [Phlebopus sp. FC_14]|nr:hypothetical protein F5I97DRAFT_1843306 [Phlebopus sp. FC_14]